MAISIIEGRLIIITYSFAQGDPARMVQVNRVLKQRQLLSYRWRVKNLSTERKNA